MTWRANVAPSHAIPDGVPSGSSGPIVAAVLLEQLPIGVVVVDHGARIQHANAAAQRLCHLADAALETRALVDVCPLPELDTLLAEVQSTRLTVVREPVPLEIAGAVHQIRLTATPLEAQSVLLTLEERPALSGERQRIDDELARLRHEHAAARASYQRLRDEFIAIASHELRTPLTALVGYTYLLDQEAHRAAALGGPNFDQRLPRIVKVLQDQLARLVRLVDNVVDVGRLQTGRLALDQTPVDIEPLVGRMVGAFRLSNPTLVITLDTTDAPLVVHADAERIEQVVEEILHNAATYAGTAGMAIRLSQGLGARPSAQIAIRDQGVGISDEDQARIFRPFFQIEPWNRRGRSGMGLGLYLAREIVEQHGGTLTLVSVAGQGSTFTVALPLHEA